MQCKHVTPSSRGGCHDRKNTVRPSVELNNVFNPTDSDVPWNSVLETGYREFALVFDVRLEPGQADNATLWITSTKSF